MPIRIRDVEVQNPCHEDWDAMRIEDRRRYCDRCQEHVHDLSAMSDAEAKDFLRGRAGQEVCVSYVPRTDGTIRLSPRPAPVVPVSRLRRRRPLAVAGMAMALVACTPHGEHEALEIESEDTPVSVIAPTVIPHTPDAFEDEPCEPELDPEDEPPILDKPRIRGRIKRPVKGKIAIAERDF